MVISNILGGLGNQMFQYAVGRSISLRNRQKLKLDISSFKEYKLRKYSLACYNIQAEIASEKEILRYKEGSFYLINKVVQKIVKRKLWDNSYYLKEKYYHFDPSVLNLKGNVYLFGYWQSEKYFLDIKEIILDDFVLKKPISFLTKDYLNKILNTCATSIHIRRGDYVNNPITNKYHGTCSINYYKKAINIILENNPETVFYIFSDDLQWAKDNFDFIQNTVYVELNDPTLDYEEMYLISQCKNNIIANSSFSWWGAWLNRNPDKIVIAPKTWFKDDSININDLIPTNWIQLFSE